MALDTPPKLRRKQNLAFKLETTTGTPIALSGTDGVTNVFNPDVTYDSEQVERQSQGNLSPIVQGVGARQAKINFETELVGSGASGTIPAWVDLFKACGCQINAGVITPLTSAIQTVTIGHYIDGRLRTIAGCQGTAVIKLKRGQQARCAWSFMGVPQPDTDTAIITPTYVVSPKAPRVGASFSFASQSLRVSDIEFDIGNDVVMREDIGAVDSDSDPTGYRSALITNRKPMMKFAPEALPIATIDLPTLHKTMATSALTLTIGASAFNMFTVAAPALQITNYPGIGDRSGIYTETIDCLCTRATSLGDDEWSITIG